MFYRGRGPQLERSLHALGIPNSVKPYPEAGHGYMSHHEGLIATLGRLSPFRTGYNGPAAEDSWSRMLEFFAKHLSSTASET